MSRLYFRSRSFDFPNAGQVLFLFSSFLSCIPANLWLFNVESYKPNIYRKCQMLDHNRAQHQMQSQGILKVFSHIHVFFCWKAKEFWLYFIFAAKGFDLMFHNSITIVVLNYESYILNLIQMSCKFDFLAYQRQSDDQFLKSFWIFWSFFSISFPHLYALLVNF